MDPETIYYARVLWPQFAAEYDNLFNSGADIPGDAVIKFSMKYARIIRAATAIDIIPRMSYIGAEALRNLLAATRARVGQIKAIPFRAPSPMPL